MARLFVRANSDHADFSSGAPITGGAFSVGGWVLLNSTGLVQGLYVQSGGNVIQARVSATNNFAFSFDGTNVDSGATTLSAARWYHVLATYAGTGANQAQLWVNGSLDGSFTRTALYTHDQLRLGDLFGAFTLDGQLAEWAVWGAALSANEAAALARGVRPHRLRPGAPLLAYWPLFGLQSPEPDLTGNGFNLTLTGTALAPHAPLTPFTAKALSVAAGAPGVPVLSNSPPGVNLSWPAVPGATSYNLYRGRSSGAEAPYLSGITGTSISDGQGIPNTTYFYQLTAVSAGGDSPRSNEVSGTIPPLLTDPRLIWTEPPRPITWTR